MSYDQAIRLYGSDKPDMRLPAMTDVREAFTAEESARRWRESDAARAWRSGFRKSASCRAKSATKSSRCSLRGAGGEVI